MKGALSSNVESISSAKPHIAGDTEDKHILLEILRTNTKYQILSSSLPFGTFAPKTWKNKVKMYKVIGIQCPILHPN